MAYFEGEIPVVTSGNNNNNGWNDWSWIIGLAVVGGIFGNGGFGFGGGNRGGIAENYALATDFATIERKIDGVNNGLCDGFYAQNTNMLNGFASVQNALCQGFNGLNTAYLTQSNAIQSQLANCCCDIRQQIADSCCTTNRNLDSIKYENAKNTCDIIRAGQDNTRAILDFLTGEKIASLQAENSGLKAQISNDRQSAFIIDALAPKCPQPAYVVQPPQQVTFPTNCCGNVAYANYNSGCGCGL